MIAQGQTDMPPPAPRCAPAVRGLNKKESICSECVCEAARVGVAARPRMGEQQQCCGGRRSSSGDSDDSVSSHEKSSEGRRSEIESEGRLR